MSDESGETPNESGETPNATTEMVERTCQTCSCKFMQNAGHKPAKFCVGCRRPSGGKRNTAENKAREKLRKKSKAASEEAMARSLSAHQISELAAALSVFTDPEDAARYIGLDVTSDELIEMVEEAHRVHGDTIDGDLSALSRKLVMGIHLIVGSLVRQRDQVAPRDAPHVARALSQIYDVIGGSTQTRFSSIQLQVIGADGSPITIGGDSEENEDEGFAQPAKKKTDVH